MLNTDYEPVTEEISVRYELMPRIFDICGISPSIGRICEEVILEMQAMW